MQPAVVTEDDIRPDDAVRTDFNAHTDSGGGIDDGGGVDRVQEQRGRECLAFDHTEHEFRLGYHLTVDDAAADAGGDAALGLEDLCLMTKVSPGTTGGAT